VSVCPSCGHRNQPGAKFCSECGAALAAARPPSYEERKVVTVLFADLVGFTSRAEQLDPEDVRALLSPFYARLRSRWLIRDAPGDVLDLGGADGHDPSRGRSFPSSRPQNGSCHVHAACPLAGAGSADRRGDQGDVRVPED
jgi:ribosomal protein L32